MKRQNSAVSFVSPYLIYLLLFINICFAHRVDAQEKRLSISAEFRPRFILDNGYKCPLPKQSKSIAYVSQRSRLSFGFQKNQLEVFISAQDVRIWGDDNLYKQSGPLGNTNSVLLYLAWFKYSIQKHASLKIGRQIFSYDDQRILSARNWNDYQVGYDAVLFAYQNANNALDVALSWNAESKSNNLYAPEKLKTLDFIRYAHKFSDIDISGIALMSGNTLNDSSDLILIKGTYGLNIVYKPQAFQFRLSGYYQHNLNNHANKISAFCFSVFARKSLINNRYAFGMGMDFLSGNSMSEDQNIVGTNHCFDLLYGKRHGWYGSMDYFSTLPEAGLQDVMAKFYYYPRKEIQLQLDYHLFWLANKGPIMDGSSHTSSFLGQEFDFSVRWDIAKEIRLDAGYSMYFETDVFQELKGLEDIALKPASMAFLMICVKPNWVFSE